MKAINIPVIIPSYEPDQRLIDLLIKLKKKSIGPVIIVNDGSGHEYDGYFEKAEELIAPLNGIILKHDVNKGKGRALCTDPQKLDLKSNDWRSVFLWLNIAMILRNKLWMRTYVVKVDILFLPKNMV